jgi:type I restriction enzyme S subunit
MVLRSDKIINQLQWLAELEVGVFPKITFSELAELDVQIPSLSDQKKIASTLRLLDCKFASNLKTYHALMQMAQAIFKSWFVDFEPWDGISPPGWSEKPLSDICINITDGTHETVKDDPDGEFFLLSGRNINDGRVLISNNERKINQTVFQKLRDHTQLAKGDILISSVGMHGEMALVQEEPASFEFLSSVAITKPNPTFVSPFYLYLALLRHKKEILRLANGTAQLHITLHDIRSFSILLPDFKTMTKFVELVAPQISLISYIHKDNKTLTAIRETLLPRLLSGELSVDGMSID